MWKVNLFHFSGLRLTSRMTGRGMNISFTTNADIRRSLLALQQYSRRTPSTKTGPYGSYSLANKFFHPTGYETYFPITQISLYTGSYGNGVNIVVGFAITYGDIQGIVHGSETTSRSTCVVETGQRVKAVTGVSSQNPGNPTTDDFIFYLKFTTDGGQTCEAGDKTSTRGNTFSVSMKSPSGLSSVTGTELPGSVLGSLNLYWGPLKTRTGYIPVTGPYGSQFQAKNFFFPTHYKQPIRQISLYTGTFGTGDNVVVGIAVTYGNNVAIVRGEETQSRSACVLAPGQRVMEVSGLSSQNPRHKTTDDFIFYLKFTTDTNVTCEAGNKSSTKGRPFSVSMKSPHGLHFMAGYELPGSLLGSLYMFWAPVQTSLYGELIRSFHPQL